MKLIFAIIVLAIVSLNTKSLAGDGVIDTNASTLKWTGYHLGKSYEHWGYIKVKSGAVSLDGDKITSGNLVVDMNTMDNGDVEKAKDNAKLVNHLKSDDFFAVAKYPEAKIAIKKSEKTGDKTYKATADLTIRGITKEITFDLFVVKSTGSMLEFKADLKIARTDFKVMYGWKVENAVLAGEFRLEANITVKR